MARFTVTGNTLLSAGTVDAALAAYKGRRTMDELRRAAAALQQAYRDAGYGAVVVYVPEQSPADGAVTIAVVEGKLATVTVVGNRQFSTAGIRRALPLLREGSTPRVQDIDRQIQLANDNPARQIAVTLEPGGGPGEVDARVVVTERPVTRWSVSVDNTGNAQTGELRAAVAWRHANIGDRDEQLLLQFQTSPTRPDQVAIVTGSWSHPFHGAGVRLDAYAAYSNVDGGNTATPAGNLQFTGKGHVVGTRATWLLGRSGEVEARLGVGLDRRAYLNDCAIVGLPPGACGPAGESVVVHPATLELTLQRGGSVPVGVNLALSRNLDLGGRHAQPADFDAVRTGAPLGYTMWRFGAFASAAIGGDWRIAGRLVAQASDDALVPGEQFGVAGAGVVRGYAEREVVGDSGHALSIELVGPELLKARGGADAPHSLRWVAFGDSGRVSNRLGAECIQRRTRCTLSALGLGLRWSSGPGQVRLDLARAGRDGNRTERGDWRVHVAGSWAFE